VSCIGRSRLRDGEWEWLGDGEFALVSVGVFEMVEDGEFDLVGVGVFETVGDGEFDLVGVGVFETVRDGECDFVGIGRQRKRSRLNDWSAHPPTRQVSPPLPLLMRIPVEEPGTSIWNSSHELYLSSPSS
jgi:hypothetical protein